MVNPKFLSVLFLLGAHTMASMSLAEFMGLSEEDIRDNLHKKIVGGHSPLYAAVCQDNHESESIIRRLVELKANLDFSDGRSWTPLRHAVNHGKQEMVNLLLELKADVHEEGLRPDGARVNSLLSDALPDDNVGIAQSLISAGAGIGSHAQVQANVEQCSILEEAIRRRALKIARLLVVAGAPVDVVHQDGSAIIDLAVARGDAQLVQALINKGARPDFQTVLGAIKTGNPKKISIISHAYRAGHRREEIAGRLSQEEFENSAVEYGFVGAAWLAIAVFAWNLVAYARA